MRTDPVGRAVMVASLALTTLSMACGGTDEASEEELHAAVAVGTVIVQPRPFTETIEAIGTVEARAGHVAALSAPASTRVTSVLTAVGERVRRGQALVELERSVFEASARSAEAALLSAQQSFDRANRLVTAGVAPRKDLDQAAAELAVAKANLVSAQRALDLAVLHSPINGVVTRLDAPLGAAVDESQVLVEIADPGALDVLAQVTSGDASRLRVGALVMLGGGDGEQPGRGTVVDISAVVDSTTRGVAVRVRPTTTHRTMRIGETLPAAITVAIHPRALVVPPESLVPEGDGFRVFVVDSANVAHARAVTIGARRAKKVLVTAGLAPGERVVTSGAYGIDEGTKVLPPKP